MSYLLTIILTLLQFTATMAVAADSLANMPARQESFWGEYENVKLEDKIRKAPPELLDYLRKDNERQGWPNKPVAAELSVYLVADARAAILELPPKLRDKISRQTVGIFFVDDLGGSGYSDYTFDKLGKSSAGIVVIDRAAIDRSANEWATWKESSPFKVDSKIKISATIETEKNNTRKYALQYILLHEFGHILSMKSELLPLWGNDWSQTPVPPAMEFFNQSWKLENENFSSLFDNKWPGRKLIAYYSSESKKLDLSNAQAAYQELSKTNFPTLYAATNPFDDFADSFASYVHVVLLGRPWRIEISSPQKKFEIDHCWDQQRCRAKKEIFAKFLE